MLEGVRSEQIDLSILLFPAHFRSCSKQEYSVRNI